MHETAMPPPIPPPASVEADSFLAAVPDSAEPCGTEAAEKQSARWSIAWAPIVLLSLLSVLLYHRIAVKLVTDWYGPDTSHGFLIPFFAAFVIWDKRRQLACTPLAPSWAGLSLVVLGLCEFLLGIFGADLFL
jgi:hypothetical protein